MNIIHHIDADGLTSAGIVKKYLNSDVKTFRYNYQRDLESYIEINLDDGDIYVVDCTLSDDFMERFKSRIIHIDHHASVINGNKTWFNHVKKQLSKIDDNGFQVSACVLCWKNLIDDNVPEIIKMLGDYDVGRFDDNNINLNTFLYYYLSDDDYFNLRILDLNISECVLQGKKINEVKSLFNKKHCQRANLITYNNQKIAILNTQEKTSNTVKSLDVDGCIIYSLDLNKIYISIYSIKNFNALNFLEKMVNCVGDCISYGGHVKACGCSFYVNKTSKIMDYLRKIDE